MNFSHHYELTEYAKDNGFNSLRFMVIGKSLNVMYFKFLDAYFGFILATDEEGNPNGDGFMRVSDLQEYVLQYSIID